MSDVVSIRSIGLNQGKSLLLAVLLTGVGAALIFILSKAFLINQDFVGSVFENGVPRALAGFFLFLFPYIHQRLAGRRRIRFSHLPEEAVPFETYTLPWYIILAYGVLIAFAIAGLSLFLIWLIGLVAFVFLIQAISIINRLILLMTFYYLGFWAGARNTQHPFLIAIGIVLGYTALELLLSSALSIESPLQGILGLVVFLILSCVAALIGSRAGRRRRLLNYVQFLLTPLPEQDRQMLVEDLYRAVKQHTR